MPKLSIDVEGRIASFMDSIDKAEHRTNKFVKNMEGSIKSGFAGLIAGIAAGLSAGALVRSFKDTLDQMDALNDAADKTGASIEELSSIFDTLSPYGATLEEITRHTSRLAQSMQEAQAGTGKAAEAFKAIGVSTKDAQGNLRPVVEVLDEVAKKLTGYADGTNKVAIAQGLLGRSGADALPLLKDMAEATRVGASVTTDQAAAAEEFNKALGRLNREMAIFRTGVVSDMLPVITRLVSEFNEGREAAGGFWAAVFQFGTDSTDIGSNVRKYTEELADLRASLARMESETAGKHWTERETEGIERYRKKLEEGIAQTERALNYYKSRQRDAALSGAGGVLDANDARAAFRAPLPTAPTVGTGSKDKEKISEAQRYIDSLNRQIALVGDLTEVEKLRNLQASGILSFESAAQRKRAESLAAEIDGAKKREEIAKEQLELAKLIEDAESRHAERIRETVQRYEDMADPVSVYKRELQEINELVEKHGLSTHAAAVAAAEAWDKTIGATRGAVEATKEAEDAAKEFGFAFESAFENAIVEGKKLSDVLKGLIQDIAKAGLRQFVTKPLLSAATEFFDSAFKPNLGAVDLTQPQLDLPTGKSMGGVSLVQNISIDSRSDRAGILQDMEMLNRQTKGEILDSMKRGGAFSR